MKFYFKAVAKNTSDICIIGGIALCLAAKVASLGGGLFALGVLLIFAGIGLGALYLILRYRSRFLTAVHVSESIMRAVLYDAMELRTPRPLLI
jgi:hypothetical protein